MIRRIVSVALDQPLFMLMLLVLFVAGGLAAFQSLPVEAFPDVTDVQVTVITLFPGHAPEEVEKQITIPLGTSNRFFRLSGNVTLTTTHIAGSNLLFNYQ